MSIPNLLIDQVWAGHPVDFALLTERGHQFVAYYDAERRLTVAGRPLSSADWTRVQPPGVPVPTRPSGSGVPGLVRHDIEQMVASWPAVPPRDSNVTGWDSHNYLALALDRTGCLHLSGNMHNNPLVYYRTREPFDLGTLARIDHMTGEREQSCTYPLFFKNRAGDLLFRYRDGGSGQGGDVYNFYDPTARAWRRQLEMPLLDGQGARNAYALPPLLGPDGWFHLVWMWRDTPDCVTNHTLSYARSRDFVRWENSRGEALPLPITMSVGEVIDPARSGEGLLNMTFSLGFDDRQRPVVAYHRYDAEGRSQIFATRPAEAGGWDVRQISRWDFRWAFAGFGSIAAEVTLGAPRPGPDPGTLVLDFWAAAAGAGRWLLRADTLAVLATLPPAPSALPAELMRAAPGLEVQTVPSRDAGRRWVLRWETLPSHRDLPREAVPPPSELRVYEMADDDPTAGDPGR